MKLYFQKQYYIRISHNLIKLIINNLIHTLLIINCLLEFILLIFNVKRTIFTYIVFLYRTVIFLSDFYFSKSLYASLSKTINSAQNENLHSNRYKL